MDTKLILENQTAIMEFLMWSRDMTQKPEGVLATLTFQIDKTHNRVTFWGHTGESK